MKDFCLNYELVSFNKISSVGPDPGTVRWFFDREECYGNRIEDQELDMLEGLACSGG